MRSQLARFIASTTDGRSARRVRTLLCESWREGVLLVSVRDHRLTWPERELLTHIGRRLYGEETHEK